MKRKQIKDEMKGVTFSITPLGRAALDGTVCAWCSELIPEGVIPEVVAGEHLHPHCASEFGEWTAPEGCEAKWSSVTNDSLVDFDGEVCRWGDLMMPDRKAVEMLGDGRLSGCYRF